MNIDRTSKIFKNIIIAVSILIPVVVVILYFFIPNKDDFNVDVRFLPKVNATINFVVSILLVLALVFIKRKEIILHKTMMLSAFILSAVFLVFYVVYHFFSESTVYGGVGVLRSIYYFILLTHIVLAAVVLPFILFSFYYALTNQTEKHRRIAKITWPIWFYVSVTGVLVYWFISPYYS